MVVLTKRVESQRAKVMPSCSQIVCTLVIVIARAPLKGAWPNHFFEHPTYLNFFWYQQMAHIFLIRILKFGVPNLGNQKRVK